MVFSNYNPIAVAVYFAGVLLCSMFMRNPIISGISLVGAILFCSAFITKKEMCRDLLFYIGLSILITASNPLFSHNGVTTLFFLNGNPVTMEAYIYGMEISLMLVSVLIWCRCISFVMTSDRMVYLLGKTAPRISIVFSAALRYIPLLKKQSKKINDVQKAIGLYSSDNYYDRLKGSLRVFSALIGWSLENAVETAKAMQAKGYGVKKRTYYSDYRFRRYDLYLLIAFFTLFSTLLYGIINDLLVFTYYPRVVAAPFSTATAVAYISFATLSLLPAIIEWKDCLLWKYYRSKI